MGFIKKIWEKTIFPQMIEEKRKEKAFMREVKQEAKEKARIEMKDKIVEVEKEKILNKMTRKKTNILEKLAKGFDSEKTNKFNELLGGSNIASTEKLNMMLGNNKPKQTKESKQKDKNDFDEKIKRMLG